MLWKLNSAFDLIVSSIIKVVDENSILSRVDKSFLCEHDKFNLMNSMSVEKRNKP